MKFMLTVSFSSRYAWLKHQIFYLENNWDFLTEEEKRELDRYTEEAEQIYPEFKRVLDCIRNFVLRYFYIIEDFGPEMPLEGIGREVADVDCVFIVEPRSIDFLESFIRRFNLEERGDGYWDGNGFMCGTSVFIVLERWD